jgi:AraC-like DNA-binding protein
MEQAGNQVLLRNRDIGLFDLSRPWQATHPATALMRVIMLTFPRALVPIAEPTIRPLVGTVMPRNLPGRSLIAQTLIELTSIDDAIERSNEPALADLLQECTVGLIRRRLGQPSGLSPHTRQLLLRARVRAVIQRHLDDPGLDVDRIARAANISPRYLHQIFQHAELPPMQPLKHLRLAKCHRALRDPARSRTPIKKIISEYGYRRPDHRRTHTPAGRTATGPGVKVNHAGSAGGAAARRCGDDRRPGVARGRSRGGRPAKALAITADVARRSRRPTPASGAAGFEPTTP